MVTSNKINNENTLGENALALSNMTLDQLIDKTISSGNKALDSSEMDIPIGDAFDKFSYMSSDLSNIIQNLPSVLPSALCHEGTDCYKKKTENDLKEKYYLAKEIALTAPEDLRLAKKKLLYIFRRKSRLE